MNRSTTSEPKNLILMAIVMLLFFAAAGLSFFAVTEYQAGVQVEQELIMSASNIRYSDEVLTMSANLAVQTGDPIWEKFYTQSNAQLNEATAKAIQLSPESAVYLEDVQIVNQRLAAAESEAFRLVFAGRKDEAAALLSSEQYQRDKIEYASGLTRFIIALQDHHQALSKSLQLNLVVTGIIVLMLFLFVLTILLNTFRLLAKRLEIEKLLSNVSKRLLKPTDIQLDTDIRWVLQQIAGKSKADHALLVRKTESGTLTLWHFPDPAQPNAPTGMPDSTRKLVSGADAVTQLSELLATIHSGSGGYDADGLIDWPRVSRLSMNNRVARQLHVLGIESFLSVKQTIGENDQLMISLAAAKHRRLAWNRIDLPILQSITEMLCQTIGQQAYKDHLFELATIDVLTGLANRRYFFERLEQELHQRRRNSVPSALLMLDLDHFKRINDTYGHAAGDAVLSSFAESTKSCLREIDTLGRLGGEEFACILPNTDKAGALLVAERIRQCIADSVVPTDSAQVRYTVSIGVTLINPSDQLADAPIKRADRALYIAKADGRNLVRWLQGES